MNLLLASILILFSPNGGCEAQIVKDLSAAKRSVLVQAYSLTSKPIIGALIADQKRGVHVGILIDGHPIHDDQNNVVGWNTPETPNWRQLTDAGCDLLIDAKHSIAHAKVIVVDSSIVYLGSFNFTWQAEHANSEVLARISGAQNQKQIAAVIDNFAKHGAHSQNPNVVRPSPPPSPPPSPSPTARVRLIWPGADIAIPSNGAWQQWPIEEKTPEANLPA